MQPITVLAGPVFSLEIWSLGAVAHRPGVMQGAPSVYRSALCMPWQASPEPRASQSATPQEISMPYQSVNPNDGKEIRSFEHLTSAQFNKSPAAAEHGFQTSRPKTYAERAVMVNKAAALPHVHVGGTRRLPCTN
ncbi:MAG: hypothetical protein ABI212_06620 [Burkholderiaceae bacterium]